MRVIGPDFIALQVRDVEASAKFYEARLGLVRATHSPPGAIVFDTTPIAFGVREPLPGVDIESIAPRTGAGTALWVAAESAQGVHDELIGAGVTVLVPPAQGPFEMMFTFADPDGYAITVHDQR